MRKVLSALSFSLVLAAAAADVPYDVLIRGGMLYDGGGGPPRRADVAIRGSSTRPVPERERVIAQLARAVHDFFLFRPAS